MVKKNEQTFIQKLLKLYMQLTIIIQIHLD